MKKYLILLLFLLPVPAMATTYYACDCQTGADGSCVAGADGNPGTNINSPWQTFGKVNDEFENLADGDSILMCRGGAWEQATTSNWVNVNSTKEVGVTVSDYNPPWGSPTAKPQISITTIDSGFNLEDSGSTSEQEEGYTFSNLYIKCDPCTRGPATYGFNLGQDVDYVTIDNMKIEGFRINVRLGGFSAINTGHARAGDGWSRHNVISSNEITGGERQGIQGNCTEETLEGNSIHRNGEATALDHGIYLGGASNCTVRNNEIYLNANGITGMECYGTQIEAHGIIDGLLIEGNLVWNEAGMARSGCWGISISVGYSSYEEFKNVVIRGNTVINEGGKGIGFTTCTEGCIVENNMIYFNHTNTGHKAIDIPAKDVDFATSGELSNNKVVVRNNSILFGTNLSTDSGKVHQGVVIGDKEAGDSARDHIVTNNVVKFQDDFSNSNCFNIKRNLNTNTTADYLLFDNNVCDYTDGSWMEDVGDLTAWRAAGPHGDNSAEASITFNDETYTELTFPNSGTGPNNWNLTIDLDHNDTDLTDAGSNDTNVSASGRSAMSSVDYDGISRSTTPDVGAFESSGSPPADTDPTNANCGADKGYTLPTGSINTDVASVTDDGLPNPPGAITWTWTQVGGGGEVTFGSPNATFTSLISTTVGAYTIQCSASDGDGTPSTDTLTLTVTASGTDDICSGLITQYKVIGSAIRVCEGGVWQ